MNRKIICSVMSIIMLLYALPTAAFAANPEELPKVGYIEVSSDANNISSKYMAVEKDGIIYLSAEDIAAVAGYDLDVDEVDGFMNYSKTEGMDYVTAVDIEQDGSVLAMGKNYEIQMIHDADRTYLPLMQMLYLLHAQWWISDEQLIIQALPSTIIDFLGSNYEEMFKNKVNQTDLLINGESKLAHTLRTSLAAAFNDFDPMMFVLWWPNEGFTPALNKEYEEALLQLAIDDMDFLNEYEQKEISAFIEGNGFTQFKSDWDNLKNIIDIPDNLVSGTEDIIEIANWVSKEAETNKYLKSNIYYDFSYLNPARLKAWSREMDDISNALDIVGILLDIAEVSQRSKKWGKQYIDQIRVLTDFDDIGYNKIVSDRVKNVANRLIDEYQDPIKAASDEAVLQSTSLLVSKIFDESLYGKYFAVFNAGLAIAKTNENIKNDMDAADLAYMVDCLVKTEHLAMQEMYRSYMKLLGNYVSGDFTKDDLSRLRNCIMLSLRANLRNRTFIYYLNIKLNENSDWENSAQAEMIRQQIINDYALICQLMETEKCDQLLILDDFDNMYSDEFGMVREDIGLGIFFEGDVPEDDDLGIPEPYRQIIEKFIAAFPWDDQDNNSTVIPDLPEASWVYMYYKNLSDVGYALVDIDGNGQDELLISTLDDYSKNNSCMTDAFTIIDNEAVQLLSGGERFSYHLCSDGSIVEDWSDSAYTSAWDKYIIDDKGFLSFVERVALDEYYAEAVGIIDNIYDDSLQDIQNSYFYSESNETKEMYVHISYEDARKIIQSYEEKYVHIEYTPLSEYVYKSHDTIEKAGSEEELKQILIQNVSEAIIDFTYDDFDVDGKYEAIAFCGESLGDDGFQGTLYLITGEEVKIIRERDGYWNTGTVYNFGNTKIISITKYFTTGGLTFFYRIFGNEVLQLEGSGLGEGLFQDEQGRICMSDSQYDACVDGTGHTWNIYYFYWDDGFKEYGGTQIGIDDFLAYDGADFILERIKDDGFEVTSLFQRKNGIININCCDGWLNHNVRVVLQNGKVEVSTILAVNGFYEEGIIKAALIPEIASYE